MISSCRALLALLAATSFVTVQATDYTATNYTCQAQTQRKGWHNMTNVEKRAYIDAELCLMSLPAKMGFNGSTNRFEDFMYVHIEQTNVVHDVGAFLPWHRLYMWAHENALKTECNYTGTQPYWEEALDVANLTASPVFDPVTGFGGNGTGDDSCIANGPFVNMTLHLGPLYEITDHCLSRSLNQDAIEWAAQDNVDECMAMQNYSSAYPCFSSKPHAAGHAAVGDVMLDITCSPGDPLFYLHHTNLDRLWWEWQLLNISSRIFDMDGQNVPTAEYISSQGLKNVTDATLDYDGDPGNVTTLNHTLNFLGVVPNATVGDVMDIRGGSLLCYEYI